MPSPDPGRDPDVERLVAEREPDVATLEQERTRPVPPPPPKASRPQ